MSRNNQDSNMKTRGETGRALVRLIREARPIRGWMLLSAFLNVLIIVCVLATPKLLGEIVQQMYDFREGSFTGESLTSVLRPTCLLLALIYLIKSSVTYLKSVILNKAVSRYYTCSLRIAMSDKIRRLPVKYLDSMPVGQFVERMTDDVSTLGNTLHNIVDTLTLGFLQILAVAVTMFLEDWRLALMVVVLMPLSIWLSSTLSAKSERHFDAMFEESGNHYTVVEESYSNYQTVKAFNLEQLRTEEHGRVNERLKNSEIRANFLMSVVAPIISFSNSLAYILISIVGGILIVKYGVSVGTVVTAVFFANQFSTPLEQISDGLSNMQRIRASAKRVFEILDKEEEQPIPGLLPERTDGSVELEQVCFDYDPKVPLIRDLCLTVKPGQRIAIVGPTGAGKTTLVNLLMRFYDIDSGTIRIGGYDAAEISRENVRDHFGMVLQDTWLFNGTVAENVAYSRPDATREEIVKACDDAYCDHFIRTFPKGYDTVIGEDTVSLSGGQKQLLTIARALLADREFLILDEATSNVDTRTEVLIQKAMNKLMKGRTCFIIAHRLSTIVDADVILVMNGGRIVERGTHVELLAAKGFYWTMYNSQETV